MQMCEAATNLMSNPQMLQTMMSPQNIQAMMQMQGAMKQLRPQGCFKAYPYPGWGSCKGMEAWVWGQGRARGQRGRLTWVRR